MTEHDAFGARTETELGIDPRAPTSPWHAALASFLTFTAGADLFAVGGPRAHHSTVLADNTPGPETEDDKT